MTPEDLERFRSFIRPEMSEFDDLAYKAYGDLLSVDYRMDDCRKCLADQQAATAQWHLLYSRLLTTLELVSHSLTRYTAQAEDAQAHLQLALDATKEFVPTDGLSRPAEVLKKSLQTTKELS